MIMRFIFGDDWNDAPCSRRENETVENGETQPQKLTKKAKKKLRGKEKAENVNSLDNNKQSQNSASSPAKPIDSLTNSSDKQLGNKQGSPTKNSNQSQATEVQWFIK